VPELPDVEVARIRLERWLAGATVTAARCSDRRLLRPRSPRAFTDALVGRVVRSVERRGKWLRVMLDDGGRLFSHLGMTGWWIESRAGAPRGRAERARLEVTRAGSSWSVGYLDARRFGRLIVADRDLPEWTELGPDPLVEGIDAAVLASKLARTRRAAKDAVMDQRLLAGIGNIIATEAFWYARLDPRAKSSDLAAGEVRRLARALGAEIRRELAFRDGRQEDDWTDPVKVYGRSGSPCPRCGAVIGRVVIGGRTTAFCPSCQARSAPG
jgi:formamidopyrimidine-DNA glycosylase